MTQTAQNRPAAGFTLLEVLVAVTLLALLTTLVFRGLRFGAQAWTALDRRTEATETRVAVLGVVRRMIEGAYPEFSSSNVTDRRIVFDGQPETLALVAPLPDAIEAGVMGRQRLFVGSLASGRPPALNLAWRLDLPGADGQDLPENLAKLADHIRSVRFSYFGVAAMGEAAAWSDRWSGGSRLPELVRVRIEDADASIGTWPELFVELRITTPTTCVYDPSDLVCRRVQ